VNVLVYVEGPADRAALETLLRSLIGDARKQRIGVRFIPMNGKAPILDQVGIKAADHLTGNPEDWVFALPDLYPMAKFDGTENAHRSFEALEALLTRRFAARCAKTGLRDDRRHRFRVHCLKHDLEVLLLAAPEALRARLGTQDALKGRWRSAVEDQNDDQPPKRIVEVLFNQYRRKKYIDTDDAPWILRKAVLEDVLQGCRQRFAPFVSELRAIIDGGAP
jgi:hypothetical protein